MNFSIPYENETNIYNNFNNKNELRNNLFINEDDIQFKCSHLSRSGSIESFNDDLYSSNCGNDKFDNLGNYCNKLLKIYEGKNV